MIAQLILVMLFQRDAQHWTQQMQVYKERANEATKQIISLQNQFSDCERTRREFEQEASRSKQTLSQSQAQLKQLQVRHLGY